MVFQKSLKLSSLFFILFLFLLLRLDEFHHPVFKFTDPFCCSPSLLLNPSIEFFSLLIVFFSSVICLVLSNIFYLYFNILTLFMSSVNIFMTVSLNPLISKLFISISLLSVSGVLFCSLGYILFLHFSYSLYWFLHIDKAATSRSLDRMVSCGR